MPQKSEFEKITGAKQLEMRKGTEKYPFGRNPATRISKVAGDHGDFSPSSRRFSAVFRAFLLPFLPVFSLTFLLIYWLDSSEENLSRSCGNQSTKFPIFGKAEDSVADFPPRVETRSNDVGMT